MYTGGVGGGFTLEDLPRAKINKNSNNNRDSESMHLCPLPLLFSFIANWCNQCHD